MKKFALVMLTCLWVSPSLAQPKLTLPPPLTTSSCEPLNIFRGLTPQNFLARIKSCADDDLAHALADANTPPLDFTALGCLSAVKVMKDAIIAGGALTAFQGFRRAKQSGLILNCTAYVTSTVTLQ